MRKKTVVILSLLMMLCFSSLMRAEKVPLLTINSTGKPVIDGKLNDDCWQRASGSALSPDKKDAKVSDDTFFLMTYDLDNIYLGFHVKQRYLNPVLNMLDKVKTRASRHDGWFRKDDIVEFRLMPDMFSEYLIKINMNGFAYDAKNGKTAWNAGLKTAVFKGKDFWNLEVVIPLKRFKLKASVKGLRGSEWKCNFYRLNRPSNEESAWNPTQQNRSNIKKYGIIKFSKYSPELQVKSYQKRESSIQAKLIISSKNPVLLKNGTNSQTVSVDKTKNITFEILGDNSGQAQLSAVSKRKEFFRSPIFSVNSVIYPLSATVSNPGAGIELYFNGKKNMTGKDKLTANLKITADKNVLAMKLNPGSKSPSACFSIAGKEFPLKGWLYSKSPVKDWTKQDFDDSKWGVYNGQKLKQTTYFRFHIIKNHTMFAPQLSNNTIFVANKAPMRIGFRLCSPFAYKLKNCTINLTVPAGIKIPLHDIANRDYTAFWHKLEKSSKQGSTSYKFEFQSYIPKQAHAFSSRTLHIYISPEFAKDLIGKTFSGSVYLSGRGVIEIPQKLKIKVLPRLNGVQPKKVQISVWDGNRNYLLSHKEFIQMLTTFKQMGINLLGLQYRQGRRVPLPIAEDKYQKEIALTAQKYGMKSYFAFHGYFDNKFLRDIHIKNPKSEKVDPTLKTNSWYHHVCPLYFLKSPEIKARIQKMAKLHDVICFDMEAGIWKSCICLECRKKIAKENKLKQVPSIPELQRMKKIWTKHQVMMNKRVYDYVMRIAKEVKPEIKTSIYSGYANNTPACYGIDWKLYKGIVDLPTIGYSQNGEIITATRKILNGQAIITGLAIGSKMFASEYSNQKIIGKLFYQLAAGGYKGILLWIWSDLDGRGLHSFADFTRGVAKYEKYLNEKYEISNKGKYVSGIPKEFVHIFKKDGKYLIMVINRTFQACKINVKIPTKMTTGVCFDFYRNKTFNAGKSKKITVSPNSVLLLEIKK